MYIYIYIHIYIYITIQATLTKRIGLAKCGSSGLLCETYC